MRGRKRVRMKMSTSCKAISKDIEDQVYFICIINYKDNHLKNKKIKNFLKYYYEPTHILN